MEPEYEQLMLYIISLSYWLLAFVFFKKNASAGKFFLQGVSVSTTLPSEAKSKDFFFFSSKKSTLCVYFRKY